MAEPITPPVPDGEDVTPAEGSGTDSPVSQLKDVLGEALGKSFKDDQSALKAVKDTFSYVGRMGKYQKAVEAIRTNQGLASDEDAVRYIMDNIPNQQQDGAPAPSPAPDETTARLSSLEKQLQDRNFYDENPEYKAHKALIARFGDDPAQVVQSDEFKGLYEKLQSADKAEKSRSVIHSNPRVAAVTDKVAASKEALKAGDRAGAVSSAMAAVNDSLAQ